MRTQRNPSLGRMFITIVAGLLVMQHIQHIVVAPYPQGRLTETRSQSSGSSPGVYVLNMDGTEPIQLTHGEIVSDPVWSPDGQQIAFRGTGEEGLRTIKIVRADGSRPIALTTVEDLNQLSPAWSPDGRQIAFTGERHNSDLQDEAAVFVANVDGSGLSQLSPAGSGSPTWSPDSRRIAFVMEDANSANIYTINTDGSGLTQLTHDGGYGPLWSPDGQHIAFWISKDNFYYLAVMNPDGSNIMLLSEGMDEAVWSPDGQRLAMLKETNNSSAKDEIFIVNSDGSGLYRIISRESIGERLSWSPDGNWISFSATPQITDVSLPLFVFATACFWLRLPCPFMGGSIETRSIFAIRVDGSYLTKITQMPGENREAVWEPARGLINPFGR